jgi:hypothetical protein
MHDSKNSLKIMKEVAIEEAKIELTKQLRSDFVLEKEQAVAMALKKQKV